MSPRDPSVEDDSDPDKYARLDGLAAEFAARYRRGERPPLKEYVDRYPELADEIQDLFPAIVGLEQAEEIRKDPSGGETVETSPAPSQVGDFRILRQVGRGGMGVVFEAEQVSLGRRVALKILSGGPLRDANATDRFRHEARAAARLHHTNIVPVFEVGRDGDVLYYTMQFIQGQGLDLVIEELKRLRATCRGGADRTGRGAPIRSRPTDPRPPRESPGEARRTPPGAPPSAPGGCR
jgi:eukaryotic-like serine/threonine-protein kinase